MGDDVSIEAATNPARQIRVAQQLFVHPDFETLTGLNDIGVVRVETPFVRSSTFFPIPQSLSTPADNTTCRLAGWGRLAYVINLKVI